MIYITSWDDSVQQSLHLFRSNPIKQSEGKLILKVTDDKQRLKLKTDQAQDAKKMEKLNNIYFTLMARGPEKEIIEFTGKEQIEARPARKGRKQ